MQEVRLVSEEQELESKQAWIQGAFVGWQLVGSMGGKTGSFKKYLKQLGIELPKEKVTREQVAAEKAKAFAALDLVEARFDKRSSA